MVPQSSHGEPNPGLTSCRWPFQGMGVCPRALKTASKKRANVRSSNLAAWALFSFALPKKPGAVPAPGHAPCVRPLSYVVVSQGCMGCPGRDILGVIKTPTGVPASLLPTAQPAVQVPARRGLLRGQMRPWGCIWGCSTSHGSSPGIQACHHRSQVAVSCSKGSFPFPPNSLWGARAAFLGTSSPLSGSVAEGCAPTQRMPLLWVSILGPWMSVVGGGPIQTPSQGLQIHKPVPHATSQTA